MFRRFSVNYAILSMVIDATLTITALHIAIFVRPLLPHLPFLVPVKSIEIASILYPLLPLLWILTFLFTSVYDPQKARKAVDEFLQVFLASAVATLIFSGVLYLGFRNFSRWLLVTFVVLNIIFLLGWRTIARLVFHIGRMDSIKRRVLIIGAGEVGMRVGQMIQEHSWTGLELAGYLDDDPHKQRSSPGVLGDLESTHKITQEADVDDVVIALPQRAYGKINELILTLHDLPVHVRVVPDYFSLALYRAAVEDFSGLPMINLRDPALNDVQRLIKRIFDLIVGICLLVIVSPLLFAIALMIKLLEPGPVIFQQQRVGENGRLFGMYKFRTMVLGAENMNEQIKQYQSGKLLYKKRNDPRITPFGRILRRTSLDELPQLFNVLLGDMSLVGPRPELPWVLDQYEPWQHKRFAVPQGMTGWWQVNGRADNPMHLHTEDDLYYVQNYSLWMDLYILLKTPWVVMRGKGAY